MITTARQQAVLLSLMEMRYKQ
ncbi:hypothetical protein ROI_33170 [Roseburia intestinalis M50/1]|nr:hypothetical protein ROI_33170 [Roseburia intestinalis M50/1]